MCLWVWVCLCVCVCVCFGPLVVHAQCDSPVKLSPNPNSKPYP